MTFPGAAYDIFVQNPVLRTDRVAFVASEMYHWLWTETVTDEVYEYEFSFGKRIFADKPYVAIRISGKWAIRTTPEGETRLPNWTVGTDSMFDLKKMAEAHDTIFVSNPYPESVLRGHHGPEKFLLRELWEIMRHNPAVRFIVHGRFAGQLYFQFGFAGGAIPIRESPRVMGKGQPGYLRDILGPDGGRINDGAKMSWRGNPFLGNQNLSSNKAYVALEFLKNVPIFLEKFYSTEKVIPDELYRIMALNRKNVSHAPFFSIPRLSKSPRGPWPVTGDKRMCDTCSLAYACRIYEEGSVCTLPGTDGKRLAEFFGTKNANDVIDGIGAILQFQVDRFERFAEQEIAAETRAREVDAPPPEPNPEVGKLANDIQKNAERYAKLLNPNLTRPQVAVQVNNGAVQIEQKDVTPQLRAQAARELEQSGVSRDRQTPEMVFDHIARKNGTKILEGEIVDNARRDF